MTTQTSLSCLPLPVVGETAHFALPSGDAYIGEVVAIRGDLVTLRNFAAWYEGADAPYSSPYFDDEVNFSIAMAIGDADVVITAA